MKMERDYSGFCHNGASYRVEYNTLPTGVDLLCVVFTSAGVGDSVPIVFIPGLISIIENFRETLVELTRGHTVYYLETREKGSAGINSRHSFSVEDIASDVVRFVELKFSKDEPYILAGYSLGATAIIEAFAGLTNKPDAVILVQPNGSFPFNRWLLALARVAKYVYKPVKPILKWYLRNFAIDMERDREMYLINCRNLDTAEPDRLGKAVRDLSRYRIGDELDKVSVPSLVVVASGDRFHNHTEGEAIARQIKNSCYLDMTDNRRTHSAGMAQEMEKFISSRVRRLIQEDLPLQEIF